jgi:MFS family permease
MEDPRAPFRACPASRRAAFSASALCRRRASLAGSRRDFSREAALPIPSAIVALLISVFLVIAGNGLLSTLIPLRAKLEGFPAFSIGLLGSVYFGGMLAGTLAAPAIVRLSGHIRAFTAFVAVAIVVALAYPLMVFDWAWIPLRAVIGFAFAGLYAVIESWVNGRADNSNRGAIYAFYQMVHFAGSASGQQMIALTAPTSFALFSTSAALFALALVPLSLTQADPPSEPGSVRLRLGWLIRIAPVAAVGAFAIGASNGSYWSLAPVYGVLVGLTPAQVAGMMTATILGSAVAVYPIGKLSDRLDRRLVMVGGATLGAVTEAALALAGAPSHVVLFGLMFLLGASTMTLYTLATGHANDRAGKEHGVEIASGLLFLYCVGAIVFPLFASWLMQRFGPTALFAHNACWHAALVLFVVWRMTVAPKPTNLKLDERAKIKPTP